MVSKAMLVGLAVKASGENQAKKTKTKKIAKRKNINKNCKAFKEFTF